MVNEEVEVEFETPPETEPEKTHEERMDELVTLKDEAIRVWGTNRWAYERDWYRNVLFYIGQQWITYASNERRWRKTNLPGYVPRPVTNRFAATANTIRSAVTQVQPSFRAAPVRDTEKAVQAAAGADKYLEMIQIESGFRAAKRRLASWLTLTGNGFLITEFDTSAETGTVQVSHELCLDCGSNLSPEMIPEDLTCPNCGSDQLQEDPTQTKEIPQGQMRVRALSPFDLYVDHEVMDLEDMWLVVVKERHTLFDAQEKWAEHKDKIEPDNDQDTGSAFLSSLATSSATLTGATGAGTETVGDNGRVTVYRLFCKRHRDYPKGFYAVITGSGQVVEFFGEYPYRFQSTKKAFYPIIHARYDEVPGRFWAKTPMDDLAPKQRQRNEFESLFQTATMRMANPVWLVPQGVSHSPLSGDPGIKVTYTGMGGMKPERLPGIEPPASVVAFLTQIDADFEEIAATFAALKGKNPGGVRAASAINMLMERGFGRFGSVFDNLEEMYERWGKQTLEIWRQRAVFPRVQVLSKAAGSWQFKEFSAADLQDVDIRVEVGSTRPKSQAGEQMLIQTLQQMGAINPRDPEQRTKIIEKLGGLDLLPGSSEDLRVISDENARFMIWATQMSQEAEKLAQLGPTDPNDPALKMFYAQLQMTFPLEGSALFDNHALHSVHHRRLALSDEFRALPKMVRDMLELHVAQVHLPHLLMEAQTGVGSMTLMGGQVGDPYAERQKGQKPGGASTPFGAGGTRNEAEGGNNKKQGDSIGPASQKGTG